jgi:rhodanese-related sulfurtransferase
MAVILVFTGCGRNEPAVASGADQRAEIRAMFKEYRKEFTDVPSVSPSDVMEADDDIVLVDVRTPEEQAVSMLPGAITQEAFEARQSDYEGKRIVTYCTIGYRSGLYAKRLREAGIDAANLHGSVLSWAHEGGEFVVNGETTNRVHVYGPEWNLLPEGYEATW